MLYNVRNQVSVHAVKYITMDPKVILFGVIFAVVIFNVSGATSSAAARSLVPRPCWLACRKFCRCGRDYSKCPACVCKTCPMCSKIECAKPCPYGYKYRNGCRTCQCKQRVRCSTRQCHPPRHCEHGYKIVNGCRTCVCNEPICHSRPCSRHCIHGYKVINGCKTCICNSCTSYYCKRLCPSGFKVINGCRTCQCCDPIKCSRICPLGFKKINGCNSCQCKEPRMCLMCCGPPPCCNYCGLETPPTLTS